MGEQVGSRGNCSDNKERERERLSTTKVKKILFLLPQVQSSFIRGSTGSKSALTAARVMSAISWCVVFTSMTQCDLVHVLRLRTKPQDLHMPVCLTLNSEKSKAAVSNAIQKCVGNWKCSESKRKVHVRKRKNKYCRCNRQWRLIWLRDVEVSTFSRPVIFSMGYTKTSYIKQNKSSYGTSPDPRIHKDSSPNWSAGMPETSSVISLTGRKHISN
jgi:hypothetical protein